MLVLPQMKEGARRERLRRRDCIGDSHGLGMRVKYAGMVRIQDSSFCHASRAVFLYVKITLLSPHQETEVVRRSRMGNRSRIS